MSTQPGSHASPPPKNSAGPRTVTAVSATSSVATSATPSGPPVSPTSSGLPSSALRLRPVASRAYLKASQELKWPLSGVHRHLSRSDSVRGKPEGTYFVVSVKLPPPGQKLVRDKGRGREEGGRWDCAHMHLFQ